MSVYYVANSGSDAANGLSELTPWATVAKVNGSTFAAGDWIVFNRGDRWRETLTVPSSGSAGNPITFGAYGTGADPELCGAALRTLTEYTGLTGNLIEDNFDDGDTTGWTGVGGAPYPAVSTTQKYSGGYSVKADTAWKTLRQSFTAQSELWVRAYLWPASGWSGNSECLILRHGGTMIVQAYVTATGAFSVWNGKAVANYAGSVNLTQDAWNLVEIRLVRHASAGVVQVWINGSLSINQTGKNTGDTDCDTLDFGLLTNSNTLYFDNVGVSSTGRLGAVFAGGDVGYATLGADPNMVSLEGDPAAENTTSFASLTAGQWFWDAAATRLYVKTPDGSAATDAVVETFAAAHCIYLNGHDHVAFDSLRLRGPAQYNGFYSDTGGTGITFTGVTLKDFYGYGIEVANANADALAYTVEGCAFIDAGRLNQVSITHGSSSSSSVTIDGTTHTATFYDGTTGTDSAVMKAIQLVNIDTLTLVTGATVTFPSVVGDTSVFNIDGCANPTVTLCSVTGGNHGIVLRNAAAGGTVSFNVTNATYDDGIWLYGTSDGVVVRHNLVLDSYDDGIDIDGAVNTTLYHNTVARAVDTGIVVRNSATGTVVKNNITYENGQPGSPVTGDEGGHEILVTANSATGFVSDYNCFQHTTAKVTSTPFSWGGSSYDFADWKTNSSQDANSLNADPLFTNAGTGDFTLQWPGSPAIDAGVAIAGINDGYYGSAPDIGAFETVGGTAVEGSAAGTSTATGTLTGRGALAGLATAVALATATLTGLGALAGGAAGSSTATGTLTGGGVLVGAAAGTSAASGTLHGVGALTGAAAGTATATGVLVGTGALAGTAGGAATASATLAGTGALAGSGAGTSTASATLAGAGALAGSASGSATAAGTLTGTGSLLGAASGSSAATGTLINGTPVGLAGTAAGSSGATGTLTGTGALAGTAAGTSTATGAMTAVRLITGSAAGTSAASGTLTGTGRLAGAAGGSSTASAVVTATAAIVGVAAGSSTATGTMTDASAVVYGPSRFRAATLTAPTLFAATLTAPTLTTVTLDPE